jgi:hypothetical protein
LDELKEVGSDEERDEGDGEVVGSWREAEGRRGERGQENEEKTHHGMVRIQSLNVNM